MKTRKVRGHKRIEKAIEKWRLTNLEIDFTRLKKYEYDYVKVFIPPWSWSAISFIRSRTPEPKGRNKYLILSGLIDIYYLWKKQLETLKQPYYLKIWLYDPQFSKSQVVCAIGDRIAWYQNVFYKPDQIKNFQPFSFNILSSKLENFEWDYRLDEYSLDGDDLGQPDQYATQSEFEKSKKEFLKMLKKPHRTTTIDCDREYYLFKQGDVWVGGQ